jgi:hypothetical protein
MAKKKSEEVVQPTISAVTQSETADTNLGDKTPQEIRNERADAIKQQRNIIRDERKSDNTNQANIDLAKQNIETLRSNAKLNIEQAKANRRDQYADEAISSVAKWMEDTGGQPLTEESLANILTPKQLWHFQKKYNQGSNWGNALGGRAFFGNLNDRTVQLLTEQANKKIAANKKAANERKTYVPYGDNSLEITSSRLNEIKDWGNSVTNDNITPEQAQALYSKLESYGLTVPKKTVPVLDAEGKETKDENGNVITQEVYDTDGITDINSLYSKLSVIGDNDDNADVLDELGFRDEAGNITRPHRKTYEEILAEQEKKKQELEYINQQKALARQQARLGLADLAAGIGDIIKASGGALVDKRSYQDMYNQLTAQQQKNFDGYLARMEALKQEEKAKQRLAEERAYQEKMLATQHERDIEKLLQAQGFQAGESALDRDLKRELLEKELKAKEAIAKLGEDAEVAKQLTAAQIEATKNNINIPGGNKTYTFGNKEASNAAINAMHGKLWNVLIDEDGKYKPPYSTIIKNLEGNGVEKTEQLRAVVNAALNSAEVLNNPTLLKEIQMYMTQASSGVDAPSTTQVITQAGSPTEPTDTTPSNGNMY